MANYTFEQLNEMNIFDSANIIAAMSDDERKEMLAAIPQSTLIQIDKNRNKVNESFRNASERINALV